MTPPRAALREQPKTTEMSIARVDWLAVYDLMSTCQLETCPAKQMKEQAAYYVVSYEIDFYRAVTGQRAILWSLDS